MNDPFMSSDEVNESFTTSQRPLSDTCAPTSPKPWAQVDGRGRLGERLE
ncbi:hypothetical protein AB0M83_37610 [Amycolatopsis sp. NPDC051106]